MTLSRKDKEEYLALLEEKVRRNARRDILDFTKYTMPKFSPTWFHEAYYEYLSRFANGEIKKLMVFVPPQHGKSEGSTRRLPAFILGHRPTTRIAIISYSAPKARKFNREIQRVIDTPEYAELFPGTRLGASNVVSDAKGAWVRNADECEIVGANGGGFKTVGVGGPLTGDPVDILILDDIYKDAKSAWSSTQRETVQDWYDTVAESRLHNDSQVLIVFTRWHEHDLAGHLLEQEPDEWTVVKFPALKEGPPDEIDPREEGEALWPEKHDAEKLLKVKERNPHVFGSLYQQDPKPREGLLYKNLRTYKELPPGFRIKKAVVDTADTGEDYLCAIAYVPTPTGHYILDVYYTQDGMETTEPATAKMLAANEVDFCRTESNNGGRGFTRAVEDHCRRMGNIRTSFTWYHQKDNKEVRIFSNAAAVQNMIYFPEGWEHRWPAFHRHVTNYTSQGKNAHDDAPDALTMIIEAEKSAYIVTTV